MTRAESPGFKDHFSEAAIGYAAYRPTYPPELVEFLAKIAPARALAWDAGCGSGQMSVMLAKRFERVIATDASQRQIDEGQAHPRVEYRCAAAESSGLAAGCVDLSVAAQAAHWFDIEAYYAEVRRVSVPGAAVALATYGNPTVDDELDPLIVGFDSGAIKAHWPPERRHVDAGYQTLPFPFTEISTPEFELRANWNLAELIGYIETWSALRAFVKAIGRGPVDDFFRELRRSWGDASRARTVRWPLTVRVGRL